MKSSLRGSNSHKVCKVHTADSFLKQVAKERISEAKEDLKEMELTDLKKALLEIS